MNKLKGVVGITNKTSDGYYLPFFDYDNMSLIDVVEDLKSIMYNFYLSDIHIILSTNGFNAFSLDKLELSTIHSIFEYSYRIDKKFIEYSKKKNNITLRLGNDKIYINRLISSTNKFKLSSAHYILFNDFFKQDILNGIQTTDLNFDNLTEVEFVLYMSKKYGYIDIDKTNDIDISDEFSYTNR